MTPRVFILRRDGREEGPFSDEEVLDMLDTGQLRRTDWCRLVDEPQSQLLGDLFETISPPAPEKNAAEELFEDLAMTGALEEEAEAEEAEADAEAEDSAAVGSTAASSPNRSHRSYMTYRPYTPTPSEYSDPFPELDPDDPSEQVLWSGSPSWLGYTRSFALSAILLAAGWWAGMFGPVFIVTAVTLSLLVVGRILVHRAAREFLVTTERVQTTHGIVSRRSVEIEFDDLSSIRVIQAWPLGWFGVGTVIFSADGGAEDDVVFDKIPRCRRLIRLVRDWQIHRRESSLRRSK